MDFSPSTTPYEPPPRPERADDFLALAAALDPRGAFRNDWLEAAVSG